MRKPGITTAVVPTATGEVATGATTTDGGMAIMAITVGTTGSAALIGEKCRAQPAMSIGAV